jgi:hypothetical protein
MSSKQAVQIDINGGDLADPNFPEPLDMDVISEF